MHELRGYRGNDHSLDTAAVCELFRRLLLRRLHKEERLSERFMENLLSWVHPGFSVFAGEPLSPEDAGQLGAARAMPASSRRFSRPSWAGCKPAPNFSYALSYALKGSAFTDLFAALNYARLKRELSH